MTAKFYARVLTTALMFIFINSRVLKSSRNPGCPICQYPLEKTYLLCFSSNPKLKKWVSELFRSFGFKLMLKPTEGEMSIAKDINDELYEYPYFTISETLQRLIFYSVAIKSNQNSVLIFDEPDSNMFPFYIKDFAERIANDETNQFFISTHNPYFLGSLLEKTAKNEIAVFIDKMKDYQTSLTLCSNKQTEELISLGIGSFFNLDNITAK